MNQDTKLSHGAILIASPELQDSYFKNSVVLIIEHHNERTVGIVLNRPSKIRCSQAVKTFDLDWVASQEKLLQGGPVDTRSLWILHADGWHFEHTNLFKGVSVSRSEEALAGLCLNHEQNVRLFIGHAGWGARQLEREITEGAWWVSEADASLIFDTKIEDIWHEALQGIGVNAEFLMRDSGYIH